MKTRLCLLAVSFTAALGWANPIVVSPRRALMVGETVSVKLQKEAADVEAVYELRTGFAKERHLVYFPIFAAATESPAAVLMRCGLELELNGRATELPTPCDAPREIKGLPANLRVCWFSADMDALADNAPAAASDRLVLRARYRQPLLRGRFYYVPLISGFDFADRERRAWSYQLHARTASRMPRVGSPDSDYETIGDMVTIYLRDGEIVVLE